MDLPNSAGANADPYRPELNPFSTKLWFNTPPVCHNSHWARLENHLLQIEHVDSARVWGQGRIEISYLNESEYLAAVAEVAALLKYFNKARFAKPV